MDNTTYIMPHSVDVQGFSRGKIIPASDIKSAQEQGVGFGAAALYGMGLGPDAPELLARIDPTTATKLPWDSNITRFAASIFYEGQPHRYCPRGRLQKMIEYAEWQGYRLCIGVEPEHYLVVRDTNGNLTPWDPHHNEIGGRLAFLLRTTIASTSYLTTVMEWLNTLAWGCYVGEKEEGPSQYEINWRHADALVTADRLAFFKLLVNKAAENLGAKATFMAKPFPDRTGSGLHFHCHLEDLDGNNLFLNPKEEFGLSTIGRHFIAGIMYHAEALCAVTNPTVNCYQRLGAKNEDTQSGCTWAPAGVCWGGNNRTVMIRIPAPGRIEDRSPSPNCNPYLAMACYLAAGLHGIEQFISCEAPVIGDAYLLQPSTTLPASLAAATTALAADSVMLDTLGPIGNELMTWQREQCREFTDPYSTATMDKFLQLF